MGSSSGQGKRRQRDREKEREKALTIFNHYYKTILDLYFLAAGRYYNVGNEPRSWCLTFRQCFFNQEENHKRQLSTQHLI